MSIHVCKCAYNGDVEFHLRYPGMSESEAQNIADKINGGQLDSFAALKAERDAAMKDAERYRYLRGQRHWSEALEKAIDAAIAKAEGIVK